MDVTLNSIVGISAGILVLINLWEKLRVYFGGSKNHADISKLKKEVHDLQTTCMEQAEEIKDSKEERKIMFKGVLAALKGLQEQGCNGPVTRGIREMEDYLMDSAHE